MVDLNYFSLQKLWGSLNELLIKIKRELWHRYLLKSVMSDPKSQMDILARLREKIESLSESDDKDHLQQPTKHEPSFHSNEYYDYPGKKSDSLGSQYHNGVDAKMYPHVSEQMQRSAMDHITMSFYSARKGDIFGAKLHIDLAESAIHIAGGFMSKEEYDCFEKNMEKKIESAIDFSNPNLETAAPK